MNELNKLERAFLVAALVSLIGLIATILLIVL